MLLRKVVFEVCGSFSNCQLLLTIPYVGLRVAQVRVIFKIPEEHCVTLFGKDSTPMGHLAYVEWFSVPKPQDRDQHSRMYRIKRSQTDGVRHTAIVKVDSLIRSCQLFPRFGPEADRAWFPENVLDLCSEFYINNFANHLTFQTIH